MFSSLKTLLTASKNLKSQRFHEFFFDFFPDLKTMTDVAGNPEEERRTDFYYQPWAQEAVCRYFYQKIQQKRAELDSVLGVKAPA